MYLAGYSLDNFSLMAMTIATGFVVDDAIVVMENSTRHIENGVKPMQAALLGAREVGFTVISMSLSLVAVFLPFQFLGGIPGRLFKEFTVVLSVAILFSLVVSLTTTPMMCSRLLGRDRHRKPGFLARSFNSGFESMRQGYERTLGIRAESSATDAAVAAGDHRSDGLSVRGTAEGIHAAAGHRPAAGRHARGRHRRPSR